MVKIIKAESKSLEIIVMYSIRAKLTKISNNRIMFEFYAQFRMIIYYAGVRAAMLSAS